MPEETPPTIDADAAEPIDPSPEPTAPQPEGLDAAVEEQFDDIDTWFPEARRPAVEGEAVGGPEEADRSEPEPTAEESVDEGAAAPEEGARGPEEAGEAKAEAREPVTETTDQGEQIVMPGAEWATP